MADKDKGKDKEAKGKSGNMKTIIIFVVALLIVGGGVFGATYMFMQKNAKTVIQEKTTEITYVDMGEMTANLADEGGKRYFKGQISIGYDKTDKDAETELKEKKVVVRDSIIFYLKSLKLDYINNTNNEKEIKAQLMDKINKQLTKSKIVDVRFDSIITQ
ncbi:MULTISPECIES: flagellar basal body-associated FliL family protein [unclassified Clostridium]|uniref:flagellar basal body-associated FliL family protein n=1 Tax=unclassified Clostridium TaxID=2614128 RepID=UPI0013F103CD|nr:MULTISPECIES: flagellar basal body-associated FliL family protein [unclassified Clostridium]NFG60614.1 flagellar basal body protein FliL [Clostridium botulinum]NFQ09743.1 flagellar basal body protein FliL [Clostridium botulinum]